MEKLGFIERHQSSADSLLWEATIPQPGALQAEALQVPA